MATLNAPVATSRDSSGKPALNWKDPVILFVVLGIVFGGIGYRMGLPNMLSTIMNTAHDLLLNTAFFIMALMVVTGALSSLLVEYGIIALVERLLSPCMGVLYKLPGRTSLAGIMTFFSDNPAIISFAGDKKFARGFKPIQMVSMTNFGTSFGMGFVVIAFMSSLSLEGSGVSPASATLVGFVAALAGSILSTRLMQFFCRNDFKNDTLPTDTTPDQSDADASEIAPDLEPEVTVQKEKEGSGFMRFMDAMLEGGKNGVQLGISIIPGILIITTIVFMLTMGAPEGGYTGGAYEGIGVLGALGEKMSGLFYVLFGFESPELIAFPISTLGSTGASLSLIPPFVQQGIIGGNEIAVFTAISMIWSGFLCTHTCMLDALGFRKFTGKAILSHAIAGIAAGSLAHYLYILL